MSTKRKSLEVFRIAFYLAVPVACVWIYNRPTVNDAISGRYRPNPNEYSDDPKLQQGPDTSLEATRAAQKENEAFREEIMAHLAEKRKQIREEKARQAAASKEPSSNQQQFMSK